MKIKEQFQKDSKALYSVGLLYVAKKDHASALDFFKKAIEVEPDKAELFYQYGHTLLDATLQQRKGRYGLASSEINRLKEAEEYFNKAIEFLESTERRSELVDSLINRSVARAVLDNLEGALKDVNKAADLDKNSSAVYANRGRLNRLNKDIEKAITDFERAIQLGSNKDEILPLLLSCYLEQPNPRTKEAIAVINKLYNAKQIKHSSIAREFLVECYSLEKNFQGAEALIKELYEQYGRTPRIVMAEANLRKSENRRELFETLMTEASINAEGIDKVLTTVILAQYYKNNKLYEKAIPLFESLISEGQYDDLMKDYLVCLYNSKFNREENIQKCLLTCANLKSILGEIPFLVELEATIYHQLDKLSEAKSLFERLLVLDPSRNRHKLSYASVLIEMGGDSEKQGAELILEIAGQVGDDDSESLVTSAKLLARVGFSDEAIKQAYRALLSSPADPQTQLLYIYLFLNRGNKKSDLLDSDTVKENFYAKVNIDGQEKLYLITDNPKAALVKNELYKDTGLGKQLYGRKIKEKIVNKKALGQDEAIEITQIISVYVKTFQDIMQDFERNFPEEKAIWSIKADVSALTEQLSAPLKNRAKYVDEVTKLYKSKQIPICALSTLLNIDIFKTWLGLVAMKDTNILCASGSFEEQTGELDLIGKTENVLLDPISLFTLCHLDLLNLLPKYFGKAYVMQATINDLKDISLEEKARQEDGYSTLSAQEERLHLEDISIESIKKRVEFLEKIINSVGKEIHPLGLNKPIENDWQEKEKYYSKTYVYCIQGSQQHSLTLFSDDLMFRQIVKEFSINSFSIQNFLVACLNKGVISEKVYFEKTIELAKMGYYYLAISGSMLFYSVEKSSFQLAQLEDFNSLLSIMESKETTVDSLITVFSDFVRSIYIESLPPEIKTSYLYSALRVLIQDRAEKPIVDRFTKVLSNKLGLANYLMPQINKEISYWLKYKRSSLSA